MSPLTYIFTAAIMVASLIVQGHSSFDVIRIAGVKPDLLFIAVLYFGIPQFWAKFQSGEMSSNAGGLIRWPAWLALPIGFVLLLLQGWSELIKRVAFLRGQAPDPTDKSGEKSAEEMLAEDLRMKTEAEEAAAAAAAQR